MLRDELYALASTLLKILAKQFELSSRWAAQGLQTGIPMPGRGYWARREAGKAVEIVKLPLRPPGMGVNTWRRRGSWFDNSSIDGEHRSTAASI